MKYYSSFIHSLFLCSLLLINTDTTSASSQSIINTLPGYTGTLPFKLETGYIGVGEEDEVQLFYYFIQSENDPGRDPLILWLDGGPGCSGFSGLVYEIGPLAFDIEGFDGSLPSFTLNPYSWTKLARSSCHGNPDPENAQCLYALQLVRECVSLVNEAHILEPKCKYMSPRPNVSRLGQLFLEDDPVNLLSLSKQDQPWCRIHNYATSIVWANDEAVHQVLHIRKGTITEWKRCNPRLSYKQDVESVLQHHRLLHEKGFQALAYSGDHDMVVPYLSTLKWIRDLNLTLDEDWRPWIVDGQVAGVQVIQLQNTSQNNVLQ
ncbi:Serine carboxypeptidase-like 18 [Sesamum angolense]|uniref:Serine carboxypeptidase-like 18 n=1 Tax=Sesamum angolense TaxID=2727404 RepID=A0AAE1WYT1_9LAMI|nr:Serine carboxypeptidase-like 18 [Sesamum angolense]